MKNNLVRLKETENLRNITILVTSKCTLKCKLCATYTSCNPNPSHYSYDTLVKSTRRYFNSITTQIGLVTISGGEPLLHPNLPEFMEFIFGYADRVRMIEIITNGTVVPSEKLLSVLKKCDKVNLLIDNYGAKLSCNLSKIVSRLDDYNIAYRVRNYTAVDTWCDGWIDVSDFSQKNRTEPEIEKIFQKCAFNNIYKNIDFLINGKVHMCYAIHEALPQVEELDTESVDLLNNDISNSEISQLIYNLRNRNFLMACKNCNGYLVENNNRSLPAEQME